MSDKRFELVSAGPWPDRYTFSPAVRAGSLLFLAGTTATDDDMQIVGPGDIVAQTRQIYRKFDALLRAAGGSLRDIVSTTEYVTTTENYGRTADVRREVFGGPPYPVATGVIVAGLLRPAALIEISAVAVLHDPPHDVSPPEAGWARHEAEPVRRDAAPAGGRVEAP
ncbi:MAG: RidA family protein [Candidatus Rokubacteria bacterium]|nr:RidA family protein [Candidatus Rokubacteria bacterium]